MCSIVPEMRRPRGPRRNAVDAADEPDGDPGAAGGGAGQRVDQPAGLGVGLRPRHGGHVGGVHLEDDEVAVDVHGRDGGLVAAPVGEGDLGGAVAQVVGVGEHGARGDDDAAAPAALAADADDGGAGGGEDGASGLRERPSDRCGGRGHACLRS